MKNLSLAARYRPQTFGEVIGQSLATAAFSRAAELDRVAPAYLLSGTRGVGKTTVARIFAKALNCEHAPAAEPCNGCGSCARITAGNHIDVNEIDGASNTGVDDVRALRENIGYLPMEGRYKIFIIDEAHMLSKSAFNALLKTLEEPPPRTVFIFATTEVHRFPATIVSRCQHFVFRHLPEDTIFGHLRKILEQEKIPADEAAIRMIARRASGSARDSLSLLDQTLSMCAGKLEAASTREALGLVGQEFFQELFAAISQKQCAKILELCAGLLNSGVDIGFFMRDLASGLRNLFLYRQVGEGIIPSLGLSEDETAFVKNSAGLFGLAHLHAAWQMTLQNQKSITQSLEPGSALELLLVNLAMLPRLLPVNDAVQEASATSAPNCHENMADVTYNSPTGELSHNGGKSASYAQEMPGKNWQAEEPAPDSSRNHGDSGNVGAEDWQQFCAFCHEKRTAGKDTLPDDILRHVRVVWNDGKLRIEAPGSSLGERLGKKRPLLEAELRQFLGGNLPEIDIVVPRPPRSHQELLKEYAETPEMRLCSRILGATITDCQEKTGQPQEKP